MKLFIKIALMIQAIILLSIQSVVSCIKIILLYKRSSSLPPKQKSSCTVLGNGPSLKKTLEENFHFLLSSELFCVNSFVVSDYFLKLKPQNYILFDPVFFTEEGIKRENIKTVYESLIARTDWTIYLYVPMHAKKFTFFLDFIKQNTNIRAVYFNYIVLEGFTWFKNWAFRNNLGMMQSQTVIVSALFLTVNRGFEKIFLVGADTSWHEELRINNDNLLLLKETNFYNTESQSKNEIALIDPAKKNKITMAVQFMSMAKVFKGYEYLNAYAIKQHIKIYNASAKSYIDAFERVKL